MISEFGLRFCFNFLFVAGLQFPRSGHPAALCRLGRHGAGERTCDQFRSPGAAVARDAIATMTIGVNLVVDWILSINARPSGASAEM